MEVRAGSSPIGAATCEFTVAVDFSAEAARLVALGFFVFLLIALRHAHPSARRGMRATQEHLFDAARLKAVPRLGSRFRRIQVTGDGLRHRFPAPSRDKSRAFAPS